jgi:hypothetical protein
LETCAFVRDQHTFHIDSKPVLRWLNARPVQDAIILQTVERARFVDCLFDASANAVRGGLPTAAQQPDFVDRLKRFARGLPLLVHVMVRGSVYCLARVLQLSGRPASRHQINLRPVRKHRVYRGN